MNVNKLHKFYFLDCRVYNDNFLECTKNNVIEEMDHFSDIPEYLKPCLIKYSLSVIEKVNNLIKNNAIIDPCNPYKTSYEILNDVLQTGCHKYKYQVDGYNNEIADNEFEENLKKVDHIIFGPSFTNCQDVKCVWDKLQMYGNSIFCDNIFIFNNNEKINLTVKTGFIVGSGTVQYSEDSKGLNLVIHNASCSGEDHLAIVSTILHESYHAKFRYDQWKNAKNNSEYQAIWANYANKKWGVPYGNDHQAMIKEYAITIAKNLKNFHNTPLDYTYYIGYIIEGLVTEWPGYWTEDQLQEWKEKKMYLKNHYPYICN